jgi:hypothetical protein
MFLCGGNPLFLLEEYLELRYRIAAPLHDGFFFSLYESIAKYDCDYMIKILRLYDILTWNAPLVQGDEISYTTFATLSQAYMEWYRSGHNGAHSKCVCLNGHVGSNPTHSATSEQAAYRLLRLFSKVRACSFRCSSFSAKGRVRVACSLVNALTTALAHYQPFAGTQGSCIFFVVPFQQTEPGRNLRFGLSFIFCHFIRVYGGYLAWIVNPAG